MRSDHEWGIATRRPHSRRGFRAPNLGLTTSILLNIVLFLALVAIAPSRRGRSGDGDLSVARRLLVAEQTLEQLRELPLPSRGKWLTIGIPTVPRRHSNTTYLTQTIESLLAELPLDSDELWNGQVQVLVMNNRPGEHPEFAALKERARGEESGFGKKARRYVHWLENPGTIVDPHPELSDPDDLNNPDDRPGKQVRQQTCDLLTLLRAAAPRSRFYLFMEDDFEVCPNALRALQYAMAKADSQPETRGWAALRASYGLNGVVVRSADLPDLTDYLWEHVTRKPPDLLWAEWIRARSPRGPMGLRPRDGNNPAEQTRAYVVYKHNLMRHLGSVSSFAVRPDRPSWPGCFASMSDVWSLALFERYDRRCRSVSDLSPCERRRRARTQEHREPWTSIQVNWQGNTARHVSE